jgi:hypothetical protein
MEPDLYVLTDLATSLVLDSNTDGNVYTKSFNGGPSRNVETVIATPTS